MRAIGLFGLRDLRQLELPVPAAPKAGEAVLKVAAVGICGSDKHYYNEGEIGNAVVESGMIMGHEFAAWIAETGPDVKDLKIGQLVAVEPAISCGHCEYCLSGHPNICPDVLFCGSPNHTGALANYITMPAENCFALPQDMTAADGAMLEPLGVAIHTVDLAHLRPGETVAILGAGPIGLMTAAVARLAGAGTVLVTEPLAYRRDFALQYAADAAFDPLTEDVVAQIMAATHGRGVDIAFEAAGAGTTPDQAARVTRPGGKVVVVGIPDNNRMWMTASVIRRKGLTIKLVRRMKHTYPRAIAMVQRGDIDVRSIVTHRFDLNTVVQGFETVSRFEDGVLRAVVHIAKE